MKLKKISDTEWEIPKSGEMKVPINLFVNEKILKQIQEDETLKQASNMAKLPGVLKVAVMPDAHQGYGACIGGVAGFDLEKGPSKHCIKPTEVLCLSLPKKGLENYKLYVVDIGIIRNIYRELKIKRVKFLEPIIEL